ncbi:acyl-CoA carboxylase epsilon subunit [Streptomyces sp. 142MFCol3.1]|uniref:acyl-CoA carboxylase epsilon subunit n=1 Tax=Streptomyces sp. 142MFCol3.1 TaxID=1172179 RepID=UPI0003F58ED7|nr:acyl-CoA carboxylase epsilon subunit [Streptomyces sp. 142MFCol3.1]
MTTATETAAPLVRVVRGGALPAEELAALTAVLLARAAPAADEAPPAPVVPLWDRPAPYRSPQSWRG